MMKILSIIEDDPVMKELCEHIDQRRKTFEETLSFLKKQIKDAHDKSEKDKKPLWDDLTEYLKSKGKLPDDYNDDLYNLSFDLNIGAVKLETKDEASKQGFALPFTPDLFNMMFNKGNPVKLD